MKNTWKSLLLMVVLGLASLLAAPSAQAVVTCGALSTSTLNFVYFSGTSSTDPRNVQSNVVTVTCTRTSNAAPERTMVLTANSGLHQVSAVVNGAISGGNAANVIRYNLYRAAPTASGCNLTFGSTPATQLAINFALPPNTPETFTFNYWGCISSQAIASFPEGLYTDVVGLTLSNPGLAATPANTNVQAISVNIYAPARCGVTGLGNITFAYTAFQTSPSFQSTQFNANCTNTLPYTLSLVANGASSGVVAGLRYQLGLSDTVGSAANIGPTSISRAGGATGTKVHTINAVMDAGQAGTAGAAVPQPHTLTITY
jgi:spore coat protein U-like protein